MDTVLNTNRASLTMQKKKISVVVASSEKAPQRKLNQSFINYGLMIFFLFSQFHHLAMSKLHGTNHQFTLSLGYKQRKTTTSDQTYAFDLSALIKPHFQFLLLKCREKAGEPK